MAEISTIRKRFDYKYGPSDWRRDKFEDFILLTEKTTDNTVVDGQLVREIEETKEYASRIAQVAADPIAGPPYLYGDGNFHADVFEPFQITRRITRTFEELSDTSYEVVIDDHDLLTDKHTYSRIRVNGKIPLAPTIKSKLTNLIVRPLAATLNHKCEWVDVTQQLQVLWAENENEMMRAARRKQNRDSAIQRRIVVPFNPFHKPGQTLRHKDKVRNIDVRGMIITVKKAVDEKAKAWSVIDYEVWENPDA